MMEDAKIREICSGLRDFESPVDPGLWAGISGASAAAKTGFSMSLLGKIAAGVLVGAGISTGIFLYLRDSGSVTTPVPPVGITEHKTQQSENEESTGSPKTAETNTEGTILSTEMPDEGAVSNTRQETSNTETETGSIQNDGVSDGADLGDSPEPEAPNEVDEAEISGRADMPSNPENPAFEVDVLRHQDKEDPLLWMFSARGHEAAAYSWDFGDGSVTNGKRVSHRFRQSGTYDVCAIATMPGGAEYSKCSPVEARYPVKVVLPNVFSPGSSPGVNDFYDLNKEESEHVITYTLRIFTQEGDLVFESREGQKAWDGNNRFGEPMPVGTYLVMAEAKGPGGELAVERQTLTLNR